ncbi:MAG: hypothetical protein ACMG6E_08690, partial [Candidatus Roizmanbacteria bacterium]
MVVRQVKLLQEGELVELGDLCLEEVAAQVQLGQVLEEPYLFDVYCLSVVEPELDEELGILHVTQRLHLAEYRGRGSVQHALGRAARPGVV